MMVCNFFIHTNLKLITSYAIFNQKKPKKKWKNLKIWQRSSSICFSVSDWNSFSVQKGLSESQCFKFIQKAAKTNSSQTGPEQMSLRRKPACSLLVDLFLGYCMECFFHCAVGRVVNSRSIRQRSTRSRAVRSQSSQSSVCFLPSVINSFFEQQWFVQPGPTMMQVTCHSLFIFTLLIDHW